MANDLVNTLKNFILKPSFKAYIKYGLIGLGSTFIYLFSIAICVEVFKLTPTISACIAFMISLSFGYNTNKTWTFKVTQKSKKFFVKFFFARLSGLFVTAYLTYLSTNIMKINYMIAQIFILGIVITMNFFMTKYWVFKIKNKQITLEEYMEIDDDGEDDAYSSNACPE